MGFSLPNHDAKDWKGHTEKRQKKKKKTNKKRKTKKSQGQTALDKVRAQEKKTIYMMHALMH